MKECLFCAAYFEPVISSQIYCGAMCRVEATRAKMKEHGRRKTIKKRQKVKRFCINNCGTPLSLYNDDKVCNKCKVNDALVKKALSNMMDFFDYKDMT
jgi:hypothetical protein